MPAITVVIPTLAADNSLPECLESLRRQSYLDFETVVVDNSGERRVSPDAATLVIHSERNRGYGGAVNDAARRTQSKYLAVLNDDAVADTKWLERLVAAAREHPEAGMFAPRVRLNEREIDSAGMLLCADGIGKQRGHRQPPSAFDRDDEVLLPSGSAALYRRRAFEECGMFDEDFFLYCEDTDLGLRMRWAGWTCRYVADAIVDHRYSATAGRASPMKAYYVARNHWWVVAKNFPISMWPGAFVAAASRYVWHAVAMRGGHGAAGAYAGGALQLAFATMKAWLAIIPASVGLLRKRRAIPRRITARRFRELARRFAISSREVASQ